MKGDGEAHPFLSPNDEFAELRALGQGQSRPAARRRSPRCCEFEYARSALKNGLKLEQQLGVNPYKFGMVGSTDSHTGLVDGRREQLLRQDHAAGAEPERADA